MLPQPCFPPPIVTKCKYDVQDSSAFHAPIASISQQAGSADEAKPIKVPWPKLACTSFKAMSKEPDLQQQHQVRLQHFS